MRRYGARRPGNGKRRNIQSGLSSGEGVIYAVRDAVEKVGKGGTVETVDEGVADKRLMLVTEEFVSALSVMERAGNTLSPVLVRRGTARLQKRHQEFADKGDRLAYLDHSHIL